MSSDLRRYWENAGGILPPDWPIVPFESLFLDGKSIAVGVMYPGPETPGGVPLLKVGDIKDGIVLNVPTFCISSETNREHKRTQLVGDELLITLVGNPGECVVVKPSMAGWNPARAIAVVRLKDPSLRIYLKAILESGAGKHLIDSVLNTTVQRTLNLKDVRQLPIPLPPDAVIRDISSTAAALINRIALLRETNVSLDSIVQALFKSWFVDFDPVRAKQDGRVPVGINDETAALFPDGFEETKQGRVPKNWQVQTLSDITTYIGRGISPKYLDEGGVVVINQKCIRDFTLDLSKARRHDPSARKIDGRTLLIGDILVNSTGVGTLGRVAQVLSSEEPMIVDSHVTVVRAAENLTWNYLGLSMMRKQGEIENLGEGTTGQTELNRGRLAGLQLIVPPMNLMREFDKIALHIRYRIASNIKQMQILANIRDTLVPRLISGELRMPNALAPLEGGSW